MRLIIKSAPLARLAVLSACTLTLAVTGCKSAPPPDDNAVNSAVHAKLTGDTAVASEPIQSFVQSGVVILQGSVSSEAAKALAASDAANVSGVKSVVNQLTVQTAQATPPATSTPPPPPPAPVQSRKPTSPIQKHATPRPAPQQARNEPPPPPEPVNQPAPIERRAPQPAEPPPPQAPPPPAFRNVTIPSGTTLPVRITQTLDSATAQPGDSFSGTIANDIVVDGLVAIPAGTNVSGRVDEVHEAGHFKGSSLLTISLVTLNRHGDHIGIATDSYSQEGKGRGANTAAKVGGGAAIGAILGGILGGGKGAAIGAGAGGGLGAGAQGITRGQQVQIPSETLLRFRLTTPIELRISTTRAPGNDANPQLRNRN